MWWSFAEDAIDKFIVAKTNGKEKSLRGNSECVVAVRANIIINHVIYKSDECKRNTKDGKRDREYNIVRFSKQ